MSDDFIKVHFGGMSEGHVSFTQLANEYKQVLGALEGDLNQSLSSWTGDAQAAYHKAKADWRAASTQLSESAVRLARTIGDAGDMYHGNEIRQAARWGV